MRRRNISHFYIIYVDGTRNTHGMATQGFRLLRFRRTSFSDAQSQIQSPKSLKSLRYEDAAPALAPHRLTTLRYEDTAQAGRPALHYEDTAVTRPALNYEDTAPVQAPHRLATRLRTALKRAPSLSLHPALRNEESCAGTIRSSFADGSFNSASTLSTSCDLPRTPQSAKVTGRAPSVERLRRSIFRVSGFWHEASREDEVRAEVADGACVDGVSTGTLMADKPMHLDLGPAEDDAALDFMADLSFTPSGSVLICGNRVV
jgi:hypothetical protein